MQLLLSLRVLLPIASLFACVALLHFAGADEPRPDAARGRPFGIQRRVPWTTSRIAGTPEPPPPFRARRVFSKIHFDKPTVLTSAPGSKRLFVAEHGGKVFSIPDDANCSKPDLFLDVGELVERLNRGEEDVRFVAVYGLTFHPDFARNGYCYVCYVVRHKDGGRGQHPHGTRVVRLRVSGGPPRCDVESEKVIITWLQGGHNGGCLKFGPDGCLYISTGDGGFAFPPDGRNAGQDVGNLLSAVLRINVDRPENGRAYSIPGDNPFAELPKARGEIWCYGLRNPWKMSFDRASGDLWVGDVGWELWELVYRVRRGDNFGWSLMEGRQPVHAERKRGPTPIVPPTVEIPHTDGASVTGGFVYRGKKFPELNGTYVFGDWETRRIWGVKWDDAGKKFSPRRDIVEPTVRIVGFAETNDGELLLMDYDDGTMHELDRNEPRKTNRDFPRRLSESGLFASVEKHRVAPGVVPFSIHAEQWADYATAERFLALPGTGAVKLHASAKRVAGSMFQRKMDFPKGAVLAKTISLEMEHGRPASRRRVETQVLHFDGRFWRGYSYEWNEKQTDAVLVPSSGKTRELTVKDAAAPGGRRVQSWRFASRVECIRCHNPWAEHTLAFNLPQINKDHDYGGVIDNQIRSLRHAGLLRDVVRQPDPDDPFDKPQPPRPAEKLPRLADPFDSSADVDARARAYLHANCGHCHRNGGGGSAYVHLNYELAIDKTRSLGERPSQGTFGIHNAEILAAGDPYRSVLYYRLAKLGAGRMPHIGSEVVDKRGLRLIHDWIRQLPVRTEAAEKIERLTVLDEPAVLARETSQLPRTLWRSARRIAAGNGREEPNDEDRRQAEADARRQAAERASQRSTERKRLVGELLATPSRALMLLRAVQQDRLPDFVRRHALALAVKHDDAAIRDLFEQFLPYGQRAKRLGEVFLPAQILAMSGDAARGGELWHKSKTMQCRNCHRVGNQGKQVGPDMTHIGKKYNGAQLLESILQPSKNIDPKFVTWLAETSAGKVHTGLLVEKNEKRVVLRNAQDQLIEIPAGEVEGLFPQRKSLMPELLLRDMTAGQVADLLAYLRSLK